MNLGKIKPLVFAAGIALSSTADATSDAALQFGARDNTQQVSLSPDGKLLAIIQPTQGRGAAVLIANLEGTPEMKPILTSSGSPDRLQSCNWSSNTRLVCRIYMIDLAYGDKVGFSRLVAINADGSGIKQLSVHSKDASLGIALSDGHIIDWVADGSDGTVLMERYVVPETSTGTLLAETRKGLVVERVNTGTLARLPLEQPRPDAVGYISDGRGVVRIMGVRPKGARSYAGDKVDYFYRKKNSREWLPLDTVTLEGSISTGFDPEAVDPDLDVVYGLERKDGRKALFKIALDGSLRKELVFERPDVDVNHLVKVGRQNRVVGVGWTTDRAQTAFFDPVLKQFSSSLSKALPGLPLVSFVDASADEQKLVLWAGSDTDPGRFFLFDKAAKKLTEILPVRPQLAQTNLAKVVSVTFPAADGTLIPGYLTLPPGSDGKNLPAIVMPHGGPEARDVWGFDWLPQFFANRGFAVLQPNFRGSTGYGDAWFMDNGFKSWRTAISDVNDGGRWLVKEGIAKPDKLAIFGWSYGGYVTLQSAVVDPTLFKAIVAVAPITDLDMLRREWKVGYNRNPDLVDARIGSAANAEAASPARHADRIVAPVLMFQGDVDQNVDIAESRLMASRLRSAGKKVELVEFHDLDHQLDDSGARAALLDKAVIFLHASLGM
jgi:dipeptidyl aminopeptidase/acylaminoacyl peptidase